MNTEEDDEFKRIEMESGWRKRQIEQSEMCSNYGGFCKKEWVGLTDSEYQDILIKHNHGGLLSFYNLVEEKLRQKNTE